MSDHGPKAKDAGHEKKNKTKEAVHDAAKAGAKAPPAEKRKVDVEEAELPKRVDEMLEDEKFHEFLSIQNNADQYAGDEFDEEGLQAMYEVFKTKKEAAKVLTAFAREALKAENPNYDAGEIDKLDLSAIEVYLDDKIARTRHDDEGLIQARFNKQARVAYGGYDDPNEKHGVIPMDYTKPNPDYPDAPVYPESGVTNEQAKLMVVDSIVGFARYHQALEDKVRDLQDAAAKQFPGMDLGKLIARKEMLEAARGDTRLWTSSRKTGMDVETHVAVDGQPAETEEIVERGTKGGGKLKQAFEKLTNVFTKRGQKENRAKATVLKELEVKAGDIEKELQKTIKDIDTAKDLAASSRELALLRAQLKQMALEGTNARAALAEHNAKVLDDMTPKKPGPDTPPDAPKAPAPDAPKPPETPPAAPGSAGGAPEASAPAEPKKGGDGGNEFDKKAEARLKDVPKLSDEEIHDIFFGYNDINPSNKKSIKDSIPDNPNLMNYLGSFKEISQSPEFIPTVHKIRKQFDAVMEALSLETSVGDSVSWIYWDIAKQNYYNTNKDKADKNYYIADPLKDSQVQQDIADRHIGWEVYNKVHFGGKGGKILKNTMKKEGLLSGEIADLLLEKPNKSFSLSSHQLTALGKLIREQFNVKTESKSKAKPAEAKAAPKAPENAAAPAAAAEAHTAPAPAEHAKPAAEKKEPEVNVVGAVEEAIKQFKTYERAYDDAPSRSKEHDDELQRRLSEVYKAEGAAIDALFKKIKKAKLTDLIKDFQRLVAVDRSTKVAVIRRIIEKKNDPKTDSATKLQLNSIRAAIDPHFNKKVK